MANSAPLPPWPLSEIVLLKERIAPHFVFGLFCAVSPLALFPLRESIRRREPLRALLLLASAVSTVYLQLISYDAGYNWAFGYSGAREKAARIAQAGMLGKAITGAVVGYYLGVGEGGMWLRTLIKDRSKPARKPITSLFQLYIMVNFGRDYVPKNPDYDPLRVALVLMSNFAWWMLAWVVLWRGWIGENVEVSTGVAEGGESAQSGDVDESGDDKAEETEAVDGTKKSANGTPKAKKGKGRKDW